MRRAAPARRWPTGSSPSSVGFDHPGPQPHSISLALARSPQVATTDPHHAPQICSSLRGGTPHFPAEPQRRECSPLGGVAAGTRGKINRKKIKRAQSHGGKGKPIREEGWKSWGLRGTKERVLRGVTLGRDTGMLYGPKL